MGITRWKTLGEKILGKKYNLSIVPADNFLMRKLNKKYRSKDKSTNVLSFPLDKNTGEIFINEALAKKEAKEYKLPQKDYLDYLILHSLLHLKGYDHGEEMLKRERKILKEEFKNIKFEI
mgnify:CR=1 FL=1